MPARENPPSLMLRLWSLPSRLLLVLPAIVMIMIGSDSTTAADSGCHLATPAAGTPVASDPGRIIVGESEALLWGTGGTGVLLVHGAIYDAASWSEQAVAMADAGFAVLALESIGQGDVLDGIEVLAEAVCVERIVVVGASAGASSAIGAVSNRSIDIDGLVVLAGSGDVTGLGTYPKLFVAAEGDGVASAMERMANEAPGVENTSLLLPGSAHAQAIFATDQGAALLESMIAFIESVDMA